MIDKLDNELRFQQDAMSLRAERQQVLANNIANADTPNFRARDFDFSAELASSLQKSHTQGRGMTLATTSDRHLHADSSSVSSRDLLYRVPDQPSLDGNTVDMDRERAAFVDNAVRYEATLRFINGSAKTMLSAIQGQ